MLSFKSKTGIVQIQWLVWVFIFLVVMLSLITMDGFLQASVYALLNTSFYAAIIYGNILWLYPSLYLKGKVAVYILTSTVFLIGISAVRTIVSLLVYNILFAKHPETISVKAVVSTIIGCVIIFLLSFAFRILLAYFVLKQQAGEIITQKTHAELNLLKSQVQPHFLFNTLNNIYYEAYLEAPRTASLIERLANIMRYFVDESPKQNVSIDTEIQFLENYIELEKIRLRYDINLSFTKNCDNVISLPPMLFMTFVENIFKHGIDKSSGNNKIVIKLEQQNGRLLFTTTNTIPANNLGNASTGFGIKNLHKRLVLLYQTNFTLEVSNKDDIYTAYLNIPLV